MFLLDAALNGAPAAAKAAGVTTEVDLSLWELCLRGGWLMLPIALLSLVCVYVFIERAVVIYRAGRTDDSFMKRIRAYVHEGDLESANNLCRKTDNPASRLVEKGLSRIGRPVNDILA